MYAKILRHLPSRGNGNGRAVTFAVRHFVKSATVVTPNTQPGVSQNFEQPQQKPTQQNLTHEKTEKARNSSINIEFVLNNIDQPFWVRTPVDLAMLKAENLDQLLGTVEKYALTGPQCVTLLALLAKFKADVGDQALKLQLDARFKNCMQQLFSEQAGTLTFGQYILAFRSLLFVGMPVGHTFCDAMRTSLQALIETDNASTTSLINFTCFYADFDPLMTSPTSSAKEGEKNAPSSKPGAIFKSRFMMSLEQCVTSRIFSVHDCNSLLLVYKKLCKVGRQKPVAEDGGISKALLLAVEERCCELAEIMSTKDLVKTLELSCAANGRNSQLLKAVGSALYSRLEVQPMPLRTLVSLLTQLNQLNYFTPQILEKIRFDVLQSFDNKEGVHKSSEISSLCAQLSIGHIRCPQITEKIASWLDTNYDSCPSCDLASFVMMLARCNFVHEVEGGGAPGSETLISQLVDRITTDANAQPIADVTVWLNYVWSLAILQRLTPDLAQSVLRPEFLSNLTTKEAAENKKNSQNRVKCLNINSAAKLEIDSYSGPSLSTSELPHFFEHLNLVPRKQKAILLDSLLKGLYLLAPKDKFSRTNYICEEGYTIDALVHLDSDGKPVPVADWSGPNCGSHKKIACLLFDFRDSTRMSTCLTGQNAMAVRHLKKLGYIVAEIHWSDLAAHTTVLHGFNYLKNLFEKIKAETLDGRK